MISFHCPDLIPPSLLSSHRASGSVWFNLVSRTANPRTVVLERKLQKLEKFNRGTLLTCKDLCSRQNAHSITRRRSMHSVGWLVDILNTLIMDKTFLLVAVVLLLLRGHFLFLTFWMGGWIKMVSQVVLGGGIIRMGWMKAVVVRSPFFLKFCLESKLILRTEGRTCLNE